MMMEKLVASRNYELLSFSPALAFFSSDLRRKIQKGRCMELPSFFSHGSSFSSPIDLQLVLPMSLEAVG
jgi:hypothetical protein